MGKPGIPRPTYTEETKAAALVLRKQNLTIEQVAELVGCDEKMVRRWSQGKNISPDTMAVADAFNSLMIPVFETKIKQAMLSMTKEKLDAAGAVDLARVIALLTDKMQLLKGKPTAIAAQTATIHRLTEIRATMQTIVRNGPPSLVAHLVDDAIDAEVVEIDVEG